MGPHKKCDGSSQCSAPSVFDHQVTSLNDTTLKLTYREWWQPGIMAEPGPEDLELIWCDECGEYHDTECPERGPLQVITTATTRARATLPPSLEMRGCTRGGEGVFCRIALLKRTQFGPLEAPRTPHTPPPRADGVHTMPLKVFSKEGVVNLDMQDESLCNWMILVRPATQHHHQNLTAYQYNHDIYFTTSQDIPAGTELRVWYAAFYAKKMSMHTLRPRGQLCVLSAEAPAGGPSEVFTQTSVEEGEDKKVWRCQVCPALFEHAQQLTDHLVVHLNEAPAPANAGSSSHPNLQTPDPTPHMAPLTTTTPHPVPHSAPHPAHHTTPLPESQLLPQTTTHTTHQPPSHVLPPIMPQMLSYAPPAVAGPAGFGAESTSAAAAASASATSELDSVASTAFSGATGPGSGSSSASGTTRASRHRKAARPYGEEAYMGLRGYGELSASEKADGEGAAHTTLRRRFSRKGYRPQRVLQCEFCQKTFSNCSNFNRHVRSHGDKMFRCEECGKDFTRKESLKQHVSYKHSRPTVDIEFPHQCIGCHKAFKTEGALQFHNCQTDERTFQCGVCMKFFSTGSNLSKHRKKHGERRFACEVCHKGFYRRDVMLEHLRRHLERAKRWSKEDGDAETEGRNKYRKEPSPCPVCNKVFSCRSNMNKHLLTHGDKKYACEICGRRFYRVDVLRDHIHVHFKDIALMADGERDTFISQLGIQADEDGPPGDSHEDAPHKYNCKRCQLTFARGGEYLSHIMEIHKERGFCCDICGRRFALKATYHAHMVIHRDRLPESDPTVHKYIHPCELCGRIFNSSGNLERHRVIHTEKTHGCDVCGKCFARKDMLKEHMRVHDNIREYLCAECGKGMKTKHALRHHMKLHKGIREFACEICGRAFSQKVNMLKHMRRHSGTKDYMCELCGKTFCERNSLEVHKLVHTVGKQFECTLCQRKFVTEYMLHKHEQLTHQRVEARACDACGAKVSTRASLTRHLKRKHPELVHIHFAQGQDLDNTPTITIVPTQLTTLQEEDEPAASSPGTKLEMHTTETTHQVVVTVTESIPDGSVTCEDGSMTCDNGGVGADEGDVACREVGVACGEAGVASAMVGVSLESAILATLDMVQRAGGSIHITPAHSITSSLGQSMASLEQPVTYTSSSGIVSLPGQNVTYTISPSSGAVTFTSAAGELPSPGHSTVLSPSPTLSCGVGHGEKIRSQGNSGTDMDDEEASVLACARHDADVLVLKHGGAGGVLSHNRTKVVLVHRDTDVHVLGQTGADVHVHAHGSADARSLSHGHEDPQELASTPWVTHGGEDDVVEDIDDVDHHGQHEHMEQDV
uniref:PR domain zinc finger protein 15-like isoform X2 n=1 Tax=Petromyzon marinus TaxID=7757 RepID=A0AAJ7U9I0_PETMA|nr:PR domain zinc finger protein 15-like isoform X2 [Petromyzon marinus]